MQTRLQAPLAAAALAMAMCGPAAAQDVDAGVPLVSELVVKAGAGGGPPWWRVSDADTTVFILGAPLLTTKGLDWEKRMLELRVKDANVVILPRTGLRFGIRIVKMTANDRAGDDAAKPRLDAAATALGQPAGRYDGAPGGGMLWTDFREKNALVRWETAKAVEAVADRLRVNVQRAGPGGDFTAGQDVFNVAAGDACRNARLDAVEGGVAPIAAALEAWTKGDPRGVLALPLTPAPCAAMYEEDAKTNQARAKALSEDYVAAISRAMRRKGHAVAVVPIGALVAENGILDELRKRGFEITLPSAAP